MYNAPESSLQAALTGSTIGGAANDGSRPDFERPEYKASRPAVRLCRDLMEGTQAIHARRTIYLPRHTGEKEKNYNIRSTIAEVFRAFQRTVQASVGMIMATPPALSDTADQVIVDDCEDIDGHGTHLEVFAKETLEDGTVTGIMAILVDFPPVPDGVELMLNEDAALGLRPYWVRYRREQILSWVVEMPDWPLLIARWKNGELTAEHVRIFARQMIVRQVVLHEPTDTRDGEYGMKTVDRYRTLSLADDGVHFKVEEKRTDTDGRVHFVSVGTGKMGGFRGKPLSAIPLAIGYTGKKCAPFVGDIPLLALAELNVGHYRVSADRRYLMKLCHAPTLALIGVDETDGVDDAGMPKKREVVVGPNDVLFLPLGGDAKYVAADANALASSKEEKDDLLRQMAALGMSFLAKDRRGSTETAAGRRLDDAAENATHATSARALQDTLETALSFHAEYRGVPAPEAVVNTTYAADSVDAAIAAVLWNAVAADRLPIEAFLEYIKTGQLPDEIDLDGLAQIRALKDAINATAQRDAQTVNGDPSVIGSVKPKDVPAVPVVPAAA